MRMLLAHLDIKKGGLEKLLLMKRAGTREAVPFAGPNYHPPCEGGHGHLIATEFKRNGWTSKKYISRLEQYGQTLCGPPQQSRPVLILEDCPGSPFPMVKITRSLAYCSYYTVSLLLEKRLSDWSSPKMSHSSMDLSSNLTTRCRPVGRRNFRRF